MIMADSRLRVLWLAAVLVIALTLATACRAIHEDEQGLRDWVMRFAGNVRYAAVSSVPDPSLVYVLSEEGAVSALDLSPRGALNLTWREVFSDAPQCLAAAEAAVLAVDARGSAYLLNPTQGFIETTFLLQWPSGSTAPAAAVACSIVKDRATVAMLDKASGIVRIYRFDITAEDEVVLPTASIPVDKEAAYLRLGGAQHLWVASFDGKTAHYNAETSAKVTDIDGFTAFAGPDGEFVLVKKDGIVSKAAQGGEIALPCELCSATFTVSPATGAVVAPEDSESTSMVTVRTSDGVARVTFPVGEVDLPGTAPTAVNYPLLAFTRSSEYGVVYALVKKANRHLVLVRSDGAVVWERREGLSGVSATLIVAPPHQNLDRFHFNKQVLLASRYGTLYNVPLADMGTKIEVLLDFSAPLLKVLKAASMADVKIKGMEEVAPGKIAIRCKHEVMTIIVSVDLETRQVTGVRVFEDALVVSSKYVIARDLSLHGSLEYPHLFVYVADAEKGVVRGYSVSNTTKRATPAWTVAFPHPIIAHASGQDPARTAIVNELRVYPNNTGAELVEEVRHRYPTRNVVVVAYYEPASEEHLPTLVVTAMDAVTGSILATTRHEDVEGDVKVAVVEHTVVYYFMDASKMRYCFGVWEMFEEEVGSIVNKAAGATLPMVIASFFVKNDRVFSSRASRPPVVAASTLGVFGGPIVDMGVTTSPGAIARKSLVLAFETGRVAVVEFRQLLSGGQMPMPGVEKKLMSHVFIMSQMFATHRYRIAKPRHIATGPTNLESSCHIVVTGLDLFYVRSSSGKPFDLLNSDFNKPLLVALVCGFFILAIAARYFVQRKTLNMLWT